MQNLVLPVVLLCIIWEHQVFGRMRYNEDYVQQPTLDTKKQTVLGNNAELFPESINNVIMAESYWKPSAKPRADNSAKGELMTKECSCVSDYEVKDLGFGHYPRYLALSICKSGSCEEPYCKFVHYLVFVLRNRGVQQRFPNSNLAGPSSMWEQRLPKELEEEWQLVPLVVPVACVPM